MRQIFAILVLLALFATTAAAADDRPEITSQTIGKYLKVLPGIVNLVQKANPGESTGMEGLMGALKGSQLSTTLAGYLAKNGWDEKEFATVHAIVASATSYLIAKPQLSKAQQAMAAKQKEMMADPNIPDSVKQQMQSMTAQHSGQEDGLMGPMQNLVKDLSPSELEVLEANKDRIVKVYQGLRK
ncbi:MAG: hypothetical protein P8010_13180 [Desulfosarcinaceae bacterium]